MSCFKTRCAPLSRFHIYSKAPATLSSQDQPPRHACGNPRDQLSSSRMYPLSGEEQHFLVSSLMWPWILRRAAEWNSLPPLTPHAPCRKAGWSSLLLSMILWSIPPTASQRLASYHCKARAFNEASRRLSIPVVSATNSIDRASKRHLAGSCRAVAYER